MKWRDFLSFFCGIALTTMFFLWREHYINKNSLVADSAPQTGLPEAAPSPQVDSAAEAAKAAAKLEEESLPKGPPDWLPAPKYASTLADPLLLSKARDIVIEWQPVEGAVGYVLVVRDPYGKRVVTMRPKGTRRHLKDVPVPDDGAPTEYTVSLASINDKKVIGPFSPPRKMYVQKLIDLASPEVKKITVED